jgi:hypothetical protein
MWKTTALAAEMRVVAPAIEGKTWLLLIQIFTSFIVLFFKNEDITARDHIKSCGILML